MKIVKFCEIRSEFINNFRRNMIIPVIGSGFTRKCTSYKGTVPSGVEYKEYMIKEIARILHLPEEKVNDLRNSTFSKVSTAYNKVVPLNDRLTYLRDNFTSVQLNEAKQDFLSINWPYIYTLNIDDGIENNSKYDFIIYANRKVHEGVFTGKKCIIKLHGDVSEMLTYSDSHSEVFTQEQYVNSLKENTSLLNKLSHDMQFQNILFVGCSLDDEIIIL